MSDIRPPKKVYKTVEEIKQAAQTMLIDNLELETPKLVDNSDMYDILYSIANLSKANARSPQLNENGNWITYDEEGNPDETNVSAKGTLISFDEKEVIDTKNRDEAKIFVVKPSVDNDIKLGQYIYAPETEWFYGVNIKTGWSDEEKYTTEENYESTQSQGLLNIRTTGGLQVDKVQNSSDKEVLLIGSPTRYCKIADDDFNESRFYPNTSYISASQLFDESAVDEYNNIYTIEPKFISATNTFSLNINLLFSIIHAGEGYEQNGICLANDSIHILFNNGVWQSDPSQCVNNNLSTSIGMWHFRIEIESVSCILDNERYSIAPVIKVHVRDDDGNTESHPYFEANLIAHINNYGISV